MSKEAKRSKAVEKPKSEPLPYLPMESVAQFVGRMKKDYDLTNIGRNATRQAKKK